MIAPQAERITKLADVAVPGKLMRSSYVKWES